jgi:RNA 2',3'-cyclic 3'-phosphodiesterase
MYIPDFGSFGQMRAFISVEIMTGAIAKLQNEIMCTAGWHSGKMKPVDPHNFHFTLIFLGEKRDNDIENIIAKLAQMQFDSFTLEYKGIGAFPKLSSATVIWVGVDQVGRQKLAALATDVVLKMAGLGFSEDRPFSPHVTIFRAKGRPVRVNDILEKYQDTSFGSDLISKVHLTKSDLTPSGPIYSNIYTVEAKK